MEFIKQRLIYVTKILLFWILFSSCQSLKSEKQKDMLLECILSNFITDGDNGNQPGAFLVGQHDNWSESSSLIIVSYIPESDVRYINADEKSRFNQKEIFFYRTEIEAAKTNNIIQKIPNKLEWQPYESQNSGYDRPPFDPVTIQLVYNYSSNCLEIIISGENNMQKEWESKCKFCGNK